MDAHTLKVLEFAEIRRLLIERAETTLAAEQLSQLEPSDDSDTVRAGLALTSEARFLFEREQPPSLGGARDIREALERAARGGALSPEELLGVKDTLVVGRRIHEYFAKKEERAPGLTQIANNIRPLPQLERQIEDTFDGDGQVKDSASDELARLRNRQKVLGSRLLDRMQHMLHSSALSKAIQEPVLTQRNGRYVLPIKADYRGRVRGIVHDTSASGATLFIEPEEAVNMGNELRELESAEKYEIERILSRLSGDVSKNVGLIAAGLNAVVSIDFAFAKGKLSLDLDCVEARLREDHSLSLRRARHPLIPRETVVPIDVDLGRSFQALLITGPNTGGKTVTLKTVGLAVVMNQCGLHVAAADAQLAILPNVFADIGDEQSIHQSLSTFSSHIRNISRILEAIKPGALVLLDEVGAGTDPTEGAALAKALLADMVARGARVICSTHYGELKAFAYNTPGFQNAAVEFDIATLRPTYRLKMGAPGASHALTIAERYGMPHSVIEAAQTQIADRDLDVIKMVEKLEELQREAETSREEAQQRAREIRDQQAELRRELERAESIRREARGKVEDQVQEMLQTIRAEAATILEGLRKAEKETRETQKLQQDLKSLESLARETAAAVTPKPTPRPGAAPTREPKKGDRVRVHGYEQVGTLADDPKNGEVRVQVGPLRMTVPLAEITLLDEPKPTKTASRARPTGSIALERAGSISPEIHLRQMRVDEALLELDKYLDDALLAGLDKVRVIHGKGTGALRQAVRTHLRKHSAVETYTEADAYEGGAGATVVTLKR